MTPHHRLASRPRFRPRDPDRRSNPAPVLPHVARFRRRTGRSPSRPSRMEDASDAWLEGRDHVGRSRVWRAPGASFGLDPDGAPVGFSPTSARASDPTRNPSARCASAPPPRRRRQHKAIQEHRRAPRDGDACRRPQKMASAVNVRSSPRARRDSRANATEAPENADRGDYLRLVQTGRRPTAPSAAAAPDGSFTITRCAEEGLRSNALHTLRGMPVVRLTREVRTARRTAASSSARVGRQEVRDEAVARSHRRRSPSDTTASSSANTRRMPCACPSTSKPG